MATLAMGYASLYNSRGVAAYLAAVDLTHVAERGRDKVVQNMISN